MTATTANSNSIRQTRTGLVRLVHRRPPALERDRPLLAPAKLKSHITVRMAGALQRICLCVVLLSALTARLGAADIKNSDCLLCHEDQTLTKTNAAGKTISLFVDAAKFTGSVHKSNACVNCHSDLTDKHPDDNIPAKPATCVGCHETPSNHEIAVQEYTASIHGASHAQGAPAAATCSDCHGKHDMLSAKHHASPVFKLNLPTTCVACHSNAVLAEQYASSIRSRRATWTASTAALLKLGLIVAPSCNDCHGVHDIKRSAIPARRSTRPMSPRPAASAMSRSRKSTTKVSTANSWPKATNAGRSATDATRARSRNARTATSRWPATGVAANATDRLTHYRDTYHGRQWRWANRTSLRTWPPVTIATGTMTCCRPQSSIPPFPNQCSRHCQQCHPGATIGFTKYQPHANPLDRKNYPALHVTFV